MSTTALVDPPEMEIGPPPAEEENPWVSDRVLLGLSIWCMKMTRPHTQDFSEDVRDVFHRLYRDLR